MKPDNPIITFELPPSLACPLPTEARGLARDQVRLLITAQDGRQIDHTTFRHLDHYLQAGDVLVVNTSATRASALPVTLPNGRPGMVHFSQPIAKPEWLVEVREIVESQTVRWKEGVADLAIALPGGAHLRLNQRFYRKRQQLDLWRATLQSSMTTEDYLASYAQPIRYNLRQPYPLAYYQTFFSFHPGSAEMPSAGRAFTPALVDRLIAQGVTFAPILLHTGVSSLEKDETPYPEYAEVSPVTASLINRAKREGRRVIAVGTTAVRALESAADVTGTLAPYQGYTELYITHDYRMRVADGLLTGFHEPEASHLHMLQAVANREHLEQAYAAAIDHHYYWHEFGDLHLILP